MMLFTSRKEFNKAELQHAQLRIFKFLAIANAALQVLTLIQIQVFDILDNNGKDIPDWLQNHCPVKEGGWYKHDSTITQLLVCGIIACPIQ